MPGEELTFCKSPCGGNFDHDCITKWKEQVVEGQAAKCPLCRQAWDVHQLVQHARSPNIKAVAFETYTEWLYKGYIADYQGLEGDTEDQEFEFWDDLIQAYALGLKVEDPVFCDDIVEAIIEASEDGLPYWGPLSVVDIYKNTQGLCRLRELIVDLYINAQTVRSELDLLTERGEMPQEFLRDLAITLLKEKELGSDDTWDVDGIKARLGLGSDVEDHAD